MGADLTAAPIHIRIPRLLLDGIHEYTTIHPDFVTGNMSLLYIDVARFSRFAQKFGSQACNHVLDVISDTLLDLLSQNMLPWQNLQAIQIWDDRFAILIPLAVSNHGYSRLIHDFVQRTQEIVNNQIVVAGFSPLCLRYGLSPSLSIDENPPSERLYQPIMQLQTKEIIGLESLSRGPIGSELERPVDLFNCAEQLGYLLDVERICRNQAIRQSKLRLQEKLFINVSPNILSDPLFRLGETRKVIEEAGLKPGQIVFEITEHHAIDDYSAFLKLVSHYRAQGYQIAIDDVGTGHSGLVTLMQVKPDFVKIDMELIRGIDKDSIKQNIVHAIQNISAGFSGLVIAEGIETPEELECVQKCGIEYGQGFLLGMPKPSILTR